MSEFIMRIDFAWPWGWLLLFLPLFGHFLLSRDKRPDEYVRVPFLPELINKLKLNTRPARYKGRRQVLFWSLWGLLICALTQPEYLTPPQYIHKPMRDMVLILDVSGSMAKNDIQGGMTRLQAVQSSVLKFIDARNSDRIGIVIFGSNAWPFAPVSEDKRALKTRVNQLTPGMIGEQTAIGDALGVAVKFLVSSTTPETSKLAILLTDGNDTASKLPPLLAAQLAHSHHVKVHTIVFGDLQSSDEEKVDVSLLQKIAQITGGKSWIAARSGAALDNVWNEINTTTPAKVKSIGWSWHEPLFAWPLGLAMGILMIVSFIRIIREKRV
ncbi:TPA: VWA domain-containing protein [Raoultella planticola]|nr:VWA domain-containing protein [Raoultella planticola]